MQGARLKEVVRALPTKIRRTLPAGLTMCVPTPQMCLSLIGVGVSVAIREDPSYRNDENFFRILLLRERAWMFVEFPVTMDRLENPFVRTITGEEQQ